MKMFRTFTGEILNYEFLSQVGKVVQSNDSRGKNVFGGKAQSWVEWFTSPLNPSQ